MVADTGFAAPYQGTRVLVLGAGGFIGRWVARALQTAGAELTRCVRDVSADSITSADPITGQLVEADLLDHAQLAELVAAVKPALTFNLAGYGVDPTERDEALAQRTNGDLLTPLAAAVAKVAAPGWSGQRLVHVGSALEYGESAGDLQEDTAEQASTLYGCTKLAGTRALARACSELSLPALTARLFTVYGPGEHSGRLLPLLMAAARAGEAIDLTAGKQLRDFGYVEEIAEGLLRLGCARTAPGEVVNLATGRLDSVRSFAECAARQLGMPAARLRFGALPTRREEMAHEPVSIARLRERIGWSPCLGIEQGIARALGRCAPRASA